MDSPAILRLELERLKFSMVSAIQRNNEEIDGMIQQAMDEILTVEYLENHIRDCVKGSVNSEIRNQIDRFFKYGEGGNVIKKCLAESLLLMAKKEVDQEQQ